MSGESSYAPNVFERWNDPIMGIGMLIIGCCVGSFLNVAIHRVPRGLSVNEPKRSFCPSCNKTLSAWQNIPIVTWILQWGKCRNCQAPIAVRYLIVEAITGLLYFACWWLLPMTSAILAILLVTVLVVVSFIDAEHQIIPIRWTGVASLLAGIGALAQPKLLDLLGNGSMQTPLDGLKYSIIGWAAGFGALWLVIQIGKIFLGKKNMQFEDSEPWHLQEGYEDDPQLHFIVGDEAISWDDLFFRDSDRLYLEGHGIKLDGSRTKATKMTLTRDQVLIGEERYEIEKIKTLEGKADSVVVPREAMGSGDPHLLGMIGAFLGWQAVYFTIFVSSLYAIVAALVGRVGFGRPLPYGPFLALAALTWLFGGWNWWVSYFEAIALP